MPFSLLAFPRARETMEFSRIHIPIDTPARLVLVPMSAFDSDEDAITPVDLIDDVGDDEGQDAEHSPFEHNYPTDDEQPPLAAPPRVAFDEYALPTSTELEYAATLSVLSETGQRVRFGTLCSLQKTIVCFIRHFMCPLCQDYMSSISRTIYPKVLRDAGVKLIIVSNGAWEMIKSYRKIFHTPYAIYTDPCSSLYAALGMHIRTLDPGPPAARGTYVRHGLIGGIGMVVKNAVKSGMPVWKYMGDKALLGGEFVFAPGLKCIFAHRMRYTQNHLSIIKMVTKAGVNIYAPLEKLSIESGKTSRSRIKGKSDNSNDRDAEIGVTETEEIAWMEKRREEMWLLHERKRRRRLGMSELPGSDKHASGSKALHQLEDQTHKWADVNEDECTSRCIKREGDILIAGQVLEEILYSRSRSRSLAMVDYDMRRIYSQFPSPLSLSSEEFPLKDLSDYVPPSLQSSPTSSSDPEPSIMRIRLRLKSHWQ